MLTDLTKLHNETKLLSNVVPGWAGLGWAGPGWKRNEMKKFSALLLNISEWPLLKRIPGCGALHYNLRALGCSVKYLQSELEIVPISLQPAVELCSLQ